MTELLRVIRRDFGKQPRLARNLGESTGRKVCRYVLCVGLFFKALWLGMKATRRQQLGSLVRYGDATYFVSNWAGQQFVTLSNENSYLENVPQTEIKNVLSIGEMRHRFLFGFSFYTGSWLDWDINRIIYRDAFKGHA